MATQSWLLDLIRKTCWRYHLKKYITHHKHFCICKGSYITRIWPLHWFGEDILWLAWKKYSTSTRNYQGADSICILYSTLFTTIMPRLYSREQSVSPEEYPGQGGDTVTSVATNLTSPEAGHRSSDRGSEPGWGGVWRIQFTTCSWVFCKSYMI